MEGKKKSKKGLIAAIVSAVVVAGGAVAAFFIINNSNNSESVALDAITKTIKEKAHRVSGKIELSTSAVATASGIAKSKVILEVDGENNNLNGASSATMTIKADGMSDFVFRFEEVFQDDGVIYIKSSDLTSFINSITSSYSQYLSAEPLASIAAKIKSLATKISSNWWRISIPEVLETFGMKDEKFTKEYNCAVAAMNDLVSEAGLNTLADTYKNNQFLKVKNSDRKIASFSGDAYEATVDADKFVKFWDKYITTSEVKKIEECVPDQSMKEIFTSDVAAISDKPFLLDIDSNKNLRGIYFDSAKDNYSIEADIRIEEGSDSQTFTAPSGAKPITDLATDIVELVQSVVSLFTVPQIVE